MRFYQTLKKDLDVLTIMDDGQEVRIRKDVMFEYVVKCNIYDYLINMNEGEELDGTEKSDEWYVDMFWKIFEALKDECISPFDWCQYDDIYFGTIECGM